MALQYSFIDNSESNIERKKSKKHCRTLRKKHKKKSSSKIDNLLNSLSVTHQNMKEGFREGMTRESPSKRAISIGNDDDDTDDENDLGNFEPLGGPTSSKVTNRGGTTQYVPQNTVEDNTDEITKENFAQLPVGEVTAADYYKQYVPYYTQMQGAQQDVHTDKDALMTKLNYMIHLLEEQQDEKTDNVTEELVLYLFLGVFVIFVVDSFARAGKYTR